MPTWPATLPQNVLTEGYQEAPGDGRLRTQMDAGPAKMRRLHTAVVDTFSVSLSLTSAQVDTLDGFWDSDLAGGVLAFDWTHPRTGAATSFRFVDRPTRTPRQSGVRYTVRFKLEKLPP